MGARRKSAFITLWVVLDQTGEQALASHSGYEHQSIKNAIKGVAFKNDYRIEMDDDLDAHGKRLVDVKIDCVIDYGRRPDRLDYVLTVKKGVEVVIDNASNIRNGLRGRLDLTKPLCN